MGKFTEGVPGAQRRYSQMPEQAYDLAIVGAGQAGCTLTGNIAQKGVNPTTGEPLKIALLDRRLVQASDRTSVMRLEFPRSS